MLLLKLEWLWGHCPRRVMMLLLMGWPIGYVRMPVVMLVLMLVLRAILVRRLLLGPMLMLLLLMLLLLLLLLLLELMRCCGRVILTLSKRFLTGMSISLRTHRGGVRRSIRLLVRCMAPLIEVLFAPKSLRVTVCKGGGWVTWLLFWLLFWLLVRVGFLHHVGWWQLLLRVLAFVPAMCICRWVRTRLLECGAAHR